MPMCDFNKVAKLLRTPLGGCFCLVLQYAMNIMYCAINIIYPNFWRNLERKLIKKITHISWIYSSNCKVKLLLFDLNVKYGLYQRVLSHTFRPCFFFFFFFMPSPTDVDCKISKIYQNTFHIGYLFLLVKFCQNIQLNGEVLALPVNKCLIPYSFQRQPFRVAPTKRCSKHLWRSAISIELLATHFLKNTFQGLLLCYAYSISKCLIY